MVWRKPYTATLVAAVTIVLAGAANARESRESKADAANPGNRIVCKSQQATGTRFTKRICKTRAEWDAIREQHMRDAKEMIDKPVICGGGGNPEGC